MTEFSGKMPDCPGAGPEAAHPVAPRTVYVVLPAYNEASSVRAVLESLERAAEAGRLACHAIVVNDGSRDSTGDVVRKHRGGLPLTLIEHPRNLGLGAAIRSGLLKAVDVARDDDVIVTMDADDTHTAAAIAPMLARIDEGYDVLIASRYRPGSRVFGVPLFRRFLSRAASVLFQAVFPTPGVRDFTCGYRAYRATVLRNAVLRYRQEFINQEGFQCMVDILLKLRRMHLRFGEVPLVLRYDRKAGKSKMKILRTIFKTLGLLLRRRMGL
jgi:dolichol-phosphate mannosyltransferase